MGTAAIARTRLGTVGFVAGAALLAGGLLLGGAAAVEAKGKPGGGGVSHTAKQAPPIQLGTSGGWGYDLANGYCCGGTLGALVSLDGRQYILSNWHVLAADTVPGGNGRQAADGDPVIQPGLIDVGCGVGGAQQVGSLVLTDSPAASNVDAAIAEVVPGMVDADGAILGIGVPSNETAPAYLGQPVKKSGRTTRLTRSTVSLLHATVNVTYENECAGGFAFTKTYDEQIIVRNRGGKFLNSGDSGSLMLEDVTPYPRAVGLLFAGSSTDAVANPIDQVLATVGAWRGAASMVGYPAVVGPGGAASAGIQAGVERAHAAQLRHRGTLEKVPESVGHAVGIGRDGGVAIKVLVQADSPRARAAAPRELDGIPVEVEAVGRIVAY